MSAFTAKIHALLEEAKAELDKLIGHGDAEVQAATKAATEKLDEVKAAVETDAPALEHDAETAAGPVAKDIETAAKPILAEAVKDAGEIAADVAKDV